MPAHQHIVLSTSRHWTQHIVIAIAGALPAAAAEMMSVQEGEVVPAVVVVVGWRWTGSNHGRSVLPVVGIGRSLRLCCSCCILLIAIVISSTSMFVGAFHHSECSRSRQVAAQFPFPDCYLPSQNRTLPLSRASFVLSHDAATGYIPSNALHKLSKASVTSSYSKNQVGSVYRQLQDGARALDLRPSLLLISGKNGTATTTADSAVVVVFHHGSVRISVRLEQVMQEVVRWCSDNPDELVLVFFSHFTYAALAARTQSSRNNNLYQNDAYSDDDNDENNNDESDDASALGDDYISSSSSMSSSLDMVSAISDNLKRLSVPYYQCSAVYGLTVGETMDLATLPTGGYALALDGHDYYGSFCGKENWVEDRLVTCYPNKTASCTTKSDDDAPWRALQDYMLQSANNPATDSTQTLGPPYSTDTFNEIQALWQVTTASAVAGTVHVSSILADNQRSDVNRKIMDLIYDSDEHPFNYINLLAIDNVALNGNAILAVLRMQCGQSVLDEPCGRAVPKPDIDYLHLSRKQWIGTLAGLYCVWFAYSVLYLKRPKLLYTVVARLQHRWNNQDKMTDLLEASSDP
jgi:hypothetical protein